MNKPCPLISSIIITPKQISRTLYDVQTQYESNQYANFIPQNAEAVTWVLYSWSIHRLRLVFIKEWETIFYVPVSQNHIKLSNFIFGTDDGAKQNQLLHKCLVDSSFQVRWEGKDIAFITYW